MKYNDFVKTQKKLMNEAEDYMNKGLFMKWEEKMNELTDLQAKYIDERMAGIIKGGSSKSEKKAAASRENGKKGGRPKKARKTTRENPSQIGRLTE